jgi:hypothetical protein
VKSLPPKTIYSVAIESEQPRARIKEDLNETEVAKRLYVFLQTVRNYLKKITFIAKAIVPKILIPEMSTAKDHNLAIKRIKRRQS